MSRRASVVLVTGGQGFTARHLIARWLRDDAHLRVIAMGRSPELPESFTHAVSWRGAPLPAPVPMGARVPDRDRDRVRYQQVDLLDTEAVADLVRAESVDTVIHLAASLRDEPFDRLVRNNIAGTQSLLEAVRHGGSDGTRVVICSSGSVYGAVADADLPIRETLPATPIDTYSVTKRAAEDLASVHGRAFGLDIVIGRIFNVAGPGEDERHLPPSLARQFAERSAGVASGQVQVGPLDTTRDIVDVRDVAQALVVLATEGRAGELYNVASGIETPIRDVFDVLAELARQPVAGGPTLPPRRLDVARQRVDIERLRALGFAPAHPLRDTLQLMLDYYGHEVAERADRIRTGAAIEPEPAR